MIFLFLLLFILLCVFLTTCRIGRDTAVRCRTSLLHISGLAKNISAQADDFSAAQVEECAACETAGARLLLHPIGTNKRITAPRFAALLYMLLVAHAPATQCIAAPARFAQISMGWIRCPAGRAIRSSSEATAAFRLVRLAACLILLGALPGVRTLWSSTAAATDSVLPDNACLARGLAHTHDEYCDKAH